MTKSYDSLGVAFVASRLGPFKRLLPALGLGIALLGGDSTPARADDPPNGLSGTFGENAGRPQVAVGTGAMTYEVPFQLPPARGAAQPGLSLHYTSGGGVGEAGVGWSLDLPAIERAPLAGAPKYRDPASDTPADEDRYTYGGRPLTFLCIVGTTPCSSAAEADVAGPGPAWANGYRHYRLQVEGSFERFFQKPDRKTWIVQRRGGEILEFGAPLTKPNVSPPSYDVSAGTTSVFRWNLVRQRDLHGEFNTIIYSWAGTAPERQYLRDIYYSAGGFGNTLDNFAYHVELSWELPTFRQIDYTPVDRRRWFRRLRRVAVSSKTWLNAASRELVRAYTMAYYPARTFPASAGQAPLLGKSSLKSVTTEGRCPTPLAEVSGRVPDPSGCPPLPAMTFDYEPTQLAVGVATRSAVAGDHSVGNDGLPYVVTSAVMDIDRDGLPDIVQAWPQNYGNTRYNDCVPPGSTFVVRQREGVQTPDPQLVCSTDFTAYIRSAREQIAYVNRGPDSSGSVRLEHTCLDAGDGYPNTMTGYHLQGSVAARNATPFTQFSAEAIGPWGNAAMLWSIAGWGGFGIERTTAAASFCANSRSGATEYPALRWQAKSTTPGTWARFPALNANPSFQGIVDIDGDGYDDLLADPSVSGTSPSGTFKRAAVKFTQKISHLETVDGVPGPALVPFSTVDSSPISISPVGQDFSTYVDLNGDGVVDLVTARIAVEGGTAQVRPGNGRGGFACDATVDSNCNAPGDGAWVGKAYRIAVPSPTPWPLRTYIPWANANVDTHFIHDVTGDGLPDIVAYRPSNGSAPGTVKLWVNVDGLNFRCANSPDCVVATISGADQPAAPTPAYRVVFADIDGNGSEDFVLLGTTGVWHFSFLTVPPVPNDFVAGTRAPRPGLLTRINNGIGAETEVVYQTIQELERKATVDDPQSFYAPWSSHSPLVIPVVTRIATRDSRVVAGALPVEPYQIDRATLFAYRDPAFDPWEQSFKGWGRVRATGPSGETEQTWFWFGACEAGGFILPACSAGSDAQQDKALVGAVVRVDRFVPGASDRPLKWLSTKTSKFVDHPGGYLSPPGTTPDRPVMFASAVQEDTFIYDTNTAVSNENPIRNPRENQDAPSQGGIEAHLRTEIDYDRAGNAVSVKRLGRLDGNHHPLDSVIRTDSLPPSGRCQADWACLETGSKMFDDVDSSGGGSERLLRHTERGFNATGDVVSLSAELAYPQFDEASLRRGAITPFGTEAPATASTAAGMRLLRTFTVDEYGNVKKSVGGPGSARPCTVITYDPSHFQFPSSTTSYAGSLCTGIALTSSFIFDRGLAAIAATQLPNQTMQTVDYDTFGRVKAVYAPAPDAGPFLTTLATQITHHTQSPVSWTQVERRVDADAFVKTIEIFNGLAEPVLAFDQADVTADGAPWIARSWVERDSSGAPTASFRPWFYAGDAYVVAATAPSLAPASRRLAVVNDNFGRPSFAYDGAINTAQITYLPLETRVRDAEQLKPGSPFAGLSSLRKVDGHGRIVETSTPAGDGSDATVTRTTYLGTGEPVRIERGDNHGAPPSLRTIQWDSFGRMISNEEPNTSAATEHWRYVYDDEGRLVGTSDARGCGKNLHYDALSRLIAEDLSPCLPEPAQQAYTTPNLTTGDGTEAFYVYDTYESGQVAHTATFDDNASLARGQLVSVRDRGAYTRFNYDGRGRVRRTTRQMAKAGAPDAVLANRYWSRWYRQEAELDLGDRMKKRTTNVDYADLAAGFQAFETMSYSARGALREIGSNYGTLVTDLRYSASGQAEHTRYGDLAATESISVYDDRDRLLNARVRRAAAPALWSATPPPSGYTLPSNETTQLLLAFLEFTRDEVGNPTLIADNSGDFWPAGTKPVTRAISYDSAYRIQHVGYSHGADAHVSPYRAEALTGDRRPVPEGRIDSRVTSQDFTTDAQGNVTFSGDNESQRFDRSLGTIYNGTGVDGWVHGPNQLIDAGGIHAEYDAVGNLAELTVARDACGDGIVACSHRFKYEWDETGQLARARRWDFAPGPVPGFDSEVVPEWDLVYAYSQGRRTRVTTKPSAASEYHQLDVFDTLRLVHVGANAAGYVVHLENEVIFVGGTARVFYDREFSMPTAVVDSGLHIFFDIGDSLGSSTFIIDKSSGELVERTTYQPYGALETDYRPERWASAREWFKFTGKEEDIEVGVTYFGARYYNARLGRWMSADPLAIHGLGGDPNPYAYVRGRVMTHVDPFGLEDLPTPQPGTVVQPDGTTVTTSGGSAQGASTQGTRAEAVANNFAARDLQRRGLTNLAVIAAWGHVCAYCHIVKSASSIREANANLDIAHYVKVWNFTSALAYNTAIMVVAPIAMANATPVATVPATDGAVAVAAEEAEVAASGAASDARLFQMYRADLARQEIEGADAVGSALKADPYHRSASFVTDAAADGKVFSFGNRAGTVNLTQTAGEMNGVAGRFEWIVDGSGNLTHQMFVGGGRITGVPIAP